MQAADPGKPDDVGRRAGKLLDRTPARESLRGLFLDDGECLPPLTPIET